MTTPRHPCSQCGAPTCFELGDGTSLCWRPCYQELIAQEGSFDLCREWAKGDGTIDRGTFGAGITRTAAQASARREYLDWRIDNRGRAG